MWTDIFKNTPYARTSPLCEQWYDGSLVALMLEIYSRLLLSGLEDIFRNMNSFIMASSKGSGGSPVILTHACYTFLGHLIVYACSGTAVVYTTQPLNKRSNYFFCVTMLFLNSYRMCD